MVAAIAGDAVNYSVGRAIGPRVFNATDTSSRLHRLLNREHLNQAHAFFERHGGKAIVLARFVPIVRTFVPFVAGAGSMSYPAFALYNVTGGIAWVTVCVGGGYLFGDLPFVKENFSLVALGIIVVSVLPMVIEYVRARRRRVSM
jgi:membrane-associated protein